MNNLTGGCKRIMEIDNSNVTILPDKLIDRLKKIHGVDKVVRF